MNTEKHQITVNDITVEVVRKAIKNLHLGVYPPHGRVRVAAPLAVSDEAVRLAVIGKLAWIKRQQAKFEAQPRQSRREMVSGESHYFLGQRYRLRVIEHHGAGKWYCVTKPPWIFMYGQGPAPINANRCCIGGIVKQLKALVPSLLEKWQLVLGVQVADWGIKKMKTKWGACTIDARRIWINLELAKKPVQCLEYIVVHELVHLLERHHNDRFQKLMDQFMPQWRLHREELNRGPLGYENWDY